MYIIIRKLTGTSWGEQSDVLPTYPLSGIVYYTQQLQRYPEQRRIELWKEHQSVDRTQGRAATGNTFTIRHMETLNKLRTRVTRCKSNQIG